MGMLDSRVAKLEAASLGPSCLYVLSMGSARQAVAQPDAKPADIVVILRRFADPDAPAQLMHGGQ
jgi:hypothetical protein